MNILKDLRAITPIFLILFMLTSSTLKFLVELISGSKQKRSKILNLERFNFIKIILNKHFIKAMHVLI